MAIQPISAVSMGQSSKIRQLRGKNMSFSAGKEDDYENPVNRKTERNLAVLNTLGVSALVGATAGGFASCFPQFKGWKIPSGIGAAAAVLYLALSLPSKLYNTKNRAFAREKEMDVYSRQKAAQANLYGEINEEIKDENVSLDDKVRHYSTTKMADNGRGVVVQGAS